MKRGYGVLLILIIGVSLLIYSDKEAEQATLTIGYTISEAKQISPTEIQLKVNFSYSTPIAWEYNIWTEANTITCGGWSPYQCNLKTCPVYTDSYGIHHNEKTEYKYSSFTANYPSLSTFCESSTTKDFSGTTGSTTTYSLIISNFCAMGQTSVSIPIDFTFSGKTQVYYYHSRDYRICGDSQCKCYTLARGDQTSSGTQITGVQANRGSCTISLTSSQVSNPSNFPVTTGPRTTNPDITNLVTSFEEGKLIIDFDVAESCKYKFFVKNGNYQIKSSEDTESFSHKIEYIYPEGTTKIDYKIETFYTNICNVNYSSTYEKTIDVPEIPYYELRVNLSSQDVSGNTFNCKWYLDNATEQTHQTFTYRKVGGYWQEAGINKLGNDYTVEIKELVNGSYLYKIIAQDDRIAEYNNNFSVDYHEEGITITKVNEEIGNTTYYLEFKVTGDPYSVVYTYRKGDYGDIEDVKLTEWKDRYIVNLSGLDKNTKYNYSIHADSVESVGAFVTKYTSEPTYIPPETPRPEGFKLGVLPFFIIVIIIAWVWYSRKKRR